MICDVGAADEFPENGVRLVEVEGRKIGVVRWSGGWYALRNLCPHQSGPLCAGPLGPKLVSGTVGTVDLDPSVPVLVCPWHHWEFDARTGRALTSPDYRVATYTVEIEGGRVLVKLTR